MYDRLESLGAEQLIFFADQHVDRHRRHLQVGEIVGGVERAQQAPGVFSGKNVRALRWRGARYRPADAIVGVVWVSPISATKAPTT